MSSKTLYPNNVSQSSGSNIVSFNNLGNVKNSNDTFAKTNQIASKTGTRKKPATITATNFKANIPNGSTVNSVTVEYAIDYEGSVSIGKPTIDILNINGANKYGKALTKTLSKTSVTWKGNYTANSVNNSKFGVKISFPANKKAGTGYVKIKFIRVIINYTTPSYSVSISKTDNNPNYVGETVDLNVNVNNLNKVNYSPVVTISLPTGVTFNSKVSGAGSFSVNGSNITWKPSLSSSNLSNTAKIRLNLTEVPLSATRVINIRENITNRSSSVTLNVEGYRPVISAVIPEETPEEDNKGSSDVIDIILNEFTEIDWILADEELLSHEEFMVSMNGSSSIVFKRQEESDFINPLREDPQGNELDYSTCSNVCFENKNPLTYFMKGTELGLFKISVYYVLPNQLGQFLSENKVLYNEFYLNVIPDRQDLSIPYLSLLKIEGEELDRLGDYTYTLEAMLKCVTSRSQINNWYDNFRIGVFNNSVSENVTINYVTDENDNIIEEIVTDTTDYDNLTIEEIYENATFSDPLTSINTFEKKEVKFTYNEEYPLYIIITGDFLEGYPEDNSLEFKDISIKESDYEETDNQCIFPVPIKNSISLDGEVSELYLSSFQSSNPIVIYGFDMGEIETNENMSILGVQVDLTVDLSEDVIVLVKLKNNHGISGERSLLLTTKDLNDGIISLGGLFDLWGFDITDMIDLDQWEVEIVFSNPWDTESTSLVQLENIELVFFTNIVEDSRIICKVNGKDTRYYGMFVDNVDVPSGLKSKVKYLDIDGSDENDAYRMNTDKKEIEIEFTVMGCTLEETTNFLRMLGKLFSNAKDSNSNKPIPNKLEFNHYPDEYWEVILESPIDSDCDVVEYKSKLKLIVPSGTSFSNSEKVTSIVGTNTGIAKVSPLIVVLPDSSSNTFEISEKNTKQCMIINYNNLDVHDVFLIDCSNRRLYLRRYSSSESDYVNTDISEAVDWQADWFTLFGDYYFETKNCSIQTISFVERW